MSSFPIDRIVALLFTFIWILVDLGLAVVVFYRFRATVAGVLMGGSLALMSAKNFVGTLTWELVMRPYMDRAYSGYGDLSILASPETFFLVKALISFGLMLTLAVGIALIPLSLRKLEQKAAGLG